MSADNTATRYKPYPTYKPSGVEWLGEIPGHWDVTFIKRAFDVRLGKMLQSDQKNEEETFEAYLRAANIFWEGVDISDVREMWFSGYEKKRFRLAYGDLLVSEGGDVGRSALWRGELNECYFQNAINRVRGKSDCATRFLYYWMYSIKYSGYVDRLCNKATIPHYTAEKVERTEFLVPSVIEQTAIANFLDRETEKIYELIAKKERLIELLEEKRTAIISLAVTKGFDPEVPMKDSGVDWLGEIPEHWEVRKLRYLSSDIIAGPFGSSITKDLYTEEGYRVYGQEQVIPADFSIGDYYISKVKFYEMRRYEVKPGDVLISCVGTFGKIAVVPDGVEPGIINPRLIKLIPRIDEVVPSFLGVYLKSKISFNQIEKVSRGGTMGVINIGLISAIIVTLPLLTEQGKIVSFLEEETTKIDSLIAKVEEGIERHKEYRTALISAAVTGKIDVREHRLPKVDVK